MLCTSCPVECNALGANSRDPSDWCLESQWGTGRACDDACNNWQCAHDDGECSLAEITTKCDPQQRGLAASLLTPPTTNSSVSVVSVELNVLSFDPVEVSLDDTSGTWSLAIALTLSLRWHDSRLATMPCRGVLNQLLSFPLHDGVTRTEKNRHRSLLWLPRLYINRTTLSYEQNRDGGSVGEKKDEITAASFNFTRGADAPWLGAAVPPNGRSSCEDCAQQTITLQQKIAFDPGLKFGSYPFDHQEFRLRFELGENVDIFSCTELLTAHGSHLATLRANGRLSDMLPQNDEYDLEQGKDAVVASHPLLVLADGTQILDRSVCDLTIHVRRDTSMVYIKVLIPTVLIVYIGLSSVFLSAQDHSGDRAALLSVSILICMTNLAADHGLGKLRYSTWFDIFNIVQLGMQVLALFEGYVEHQLLWKGHEAESLILNSLWRWFALAGLYPLLILSVLIWGSGSRTAGITLFSVGFTLITTITVVAFRRRLIQGRHLRSKLAKDLSETDSHDPLFPGCLARAFKAYDLDGSGELDMTEVRTLLDAMFGKDKAVFTAALQLARRNATATGGTFTLNAITDLIDQMELEGLIKASRTSDTTFVTTRHAVEFNLGSMSNKSRAAPSTGAVGLETEA